MSKSSNVTKLKPRPAPAASASAADQLAARLRKWIVGDKIAIGDALPSERKLMSRFGVSRSTVREALRMLDAQGLIEVRRGRTGGSYICHQPTALVVQSLDMFIKGHDLRQIDLVMAREAIECTAAAQAAASRSDQQLEKLRTCCLECEETVFNLKAFVSANLAWHLALVEASNNKLFTVFMTSISSAIAADTNRTEFDLSIRKLVVGAHWQIFTAIRDRDPAAARRRTLRHLSAYGDMLKALADEAPS